MALRRGDRVLVDTNVILEAHRVGCWRPMATQFRLITVEKVIEETQTGHQNRSTDQNIDETALRDSFCHIAAPDKVERAAIDIDFPDHGLDDGEYHLVAYAATIGDEQAWLLNSPDRGTIRLCSRAQWLDRLVALQTMTDLLGLPHGRQLRGNYKRSWLETEINRFRFGLL